MEKLFDAIEKDKKKILKSEEDLRKIPELAFREWKTHAYLKSAFEELGYHPVEAGDIPGFFVDVDTGIPGPKIAVFGELDAICTPGHPFADPETGAAHACGHNIQCAMLLGLAMAFKAPDALHGLCGTVRLIAVPAEEGVDSKYREVLKEKGNVRYFSGKPEFLYRGYLDGVDIAMMIHADSDAAGMYCPAGSNGNVRKKATFIGKAAHASEPEFGNNALYAATAALSAANALRETFRDEESIRMHPIITKGGNVVNSIPDEVVCEGMIRGADYRAISHISKKINRAYAASAAALGCKVYFEDMAGSAPRHNDPNLREIFSSVASRFFDETEIDFSAPWGKACSDMGDVSSVIPSIHPFIGGVCGGAHSKDFKLVDGEKACITSTKILAGVICLLLENNGELGKKVIKEKKVPFASKEEFFRAKDALSFSGHGVFYNEDGTVTLKYEG